MSIFIDIIPSPDFSERPPESNVIPLPTSATEPVGLRGGVGELDEAGRLVGAAVHAEHAAEAAPAPWRARRGPRRSGPLSSATSVASSAMSRALSEPPGVFTRSRAIATASAMAAPRSTPACVALAAASGADHGDATDTPAFGASDL